MNAGVRAKALPMVILISHPVTRTVPADGMIYDVFEHGGVRNA
jgi:hypothetical protein